MYMDMVLFFYENIFIFSISRFFYFCVYNPIGLQFLTISVSEETFVEYFMLLALVIAVIPERDREIETDIWSL